MHSIVDALPCRPRLFLRIPRYGAASYAVPSCNSCVFALIQALDMVCNTLLEKSVALNMDVMLW